MIDLLSAKARQLCWRLPKSEALLEAPRRVLFVDVGFAHSTACLVGFSAEEGEVVTGAEFPDAVCSAPCGVSSFLDAMMAHSCGVIEQKHSRKIKPESKQATRLRTAMQKALKDLSVGPDAQVNLECFFPEDDIDVAICITRAQLQEFIADDVKGIGALISAAMEKAGKGWDEVTNVEVIGGGSRVVAVQEALRAQVPEHLVLGAGLDSSSCVAVGSTYFSAASQSRPPNVRATAPEVGQPAELGATAVQDPAAASWGAGWGLGDAAAGCGGWRSGLPWGMWGGLSEWSEQGAAARGGVPWDCGEDAGFGASSLEGVLPEGSCTVDQQDDSWQVSTFPFTAGLKPQAARPIRPVRTSESTLCTLGDPDRS